MSFEKMFRDVGCTGSLHVRDLGSNAEIAVGADEPVVMASTFKAIVALEFFAQIHNGRLNPAVQVEITPATATPGPTGISLYRDPVRLSLRDLAVQMMTVSDNAATDVVTDTVGLAAINARAAHCGCKATHIVSDLSTMLDGVAGAFGFASYAQLLEGQSGALGDAARMRATDNDLMERLPALDPSQATRSTARDMTTFLEAVWSDTAADPASCDDLRRLMESQVTRRLECAVPDGGKLAAKSGGLFGRVRNEIAVITYPDGSRYAATIFTHAEEAFRGTAVINRQMGVIVDEAIRSLR
jgi:beta-lactamase class A